MRRPVSTIPADAVPLVPNPARFPGAHAARRQLTLDHWPYGHPTKPIDWYRPRHMRPGSPYGPPIAVTWSQTA